MMARHNNRRSFFPVQSRSSCHYSYSLRSIFPFALLVIAACITIIHLLLHQFYLVHWRSIEPPNFRVVSTLEYHDDDAVHLVHLNEVCRGTKNYPNGPPIIPWTYNSMEIVEKDLIFSNDEYLYEKIADCPEVEIFLPRGLRDYGYCEDAMAFALYLQSRALPDWILDKEIKHGNKTLSYFDICPTTPMIFFNQYWDGVPDHPKWLKDRKLIVMPNIEMGQLKEAHYWKADIVICRTAECHFRVSKWYQQYGMKKKTQVIYTKGASSDPTSIIRSQFSNESEKEIAHKLKFYQNKFTHFNGKSPHKGSVEVLKCWKDRRDLPVLDFYTAYDELPGFLTEIFGPVLPPNVKVHHGHVNTTDFGAMLYDSVAILCPSGMEGYGHYINQARAAGTVVITTDYPPMNEFVNPDSGILVKNHPVYNEDQLLGGKYNGQYGLQGVSPIQTSVSQRELCDAINYVNEHMTIERKRYIALNARKRYKDDVVFFAHQMQEVKAAL